MGAVILMLSIELIQAIEELRQARQNFNNAAPEFIETAIFQLNAAERKFNQLIALRKTSLRRRCG
jgi:hypothetical protein